MTNNGDSTQTGAAPVRVRVRARLRDLSWALLARGVLAVVLGVAALLWPKATVALLIRLVGVYVLFDGAVTLLGAFRARELGVYLAPGLVSVVIGLVLLLWPDATGRLMLVIVGLWALIQGGMLFWAARGSDVDDPERGSAMTIGALTAVVGLVLAIWPGTGVVAISWVIGIAVLVIGSLLIYLSRRLKNVQQRVESARRS